MVPRQEGVEICRRACVAGQIPKSRKELDGCDGCRVVRLVAGPAPAPPTLTTLSYRLTTMDYVISVLGNVPGDVIVIGCDRNKGRVSINHAWQDWMDESEWDSIKLYVT